MMAISLFTLDLIDSRDTTLVGGKAANLGRLIRAGFPVPDGFVVTTRGYRFAREASNGNGDSLPHELADQIRLAYERMGRGKVAVRSSATAEDTSAASMAGQYETFLHVHDEPSLLDAIRCCWASLDSPRTRAYLGEHGIDVAGVAMAVVVQRLVAADVAGVLFTANPQTGTRREMLVEASWGLGEAVVSGIVQPDILRLDRDTGRVIEAVIADKRVFVDPAAPGERAVDESRRKQRCLRAIDVDRLWHLGRQAVEHFGAPQDIEWAIRDGELYVLQSRPITTLAEAEAYEEALRTTRADLRERLSEGHGPWVLHNLAETLPQPTPLTWSVIRKFMSGSGGFGEMYKSVGFEPSPAVSRDGFLDLIAGRVYMDLSRGPEMFFEGFPFRYDPEQLRRDPDAGQAPPTIPVGTMRARLRIGRRLGVVNERLRETAGGFDRKLKDEIIPPFVEWIKSQRERDLVTMPTDDLVNLWHERQKRVLDEFAPQSLLPSLISGMALADLRAFLDQSFYQGDEDPDALAHLLSSAAPADRTIQSDALLYRVAQGERPLAEWLAEYGHRASGEFDLAAPRWREQPAQAEALAQRLRGGVDPIERHREHSKKVTARLGELRARLSGPDQAELDRLLAALWRYVPFREDGKYYLMLGYELLRDVALEAGRRLEIGEDVFLLSEEDLLDALRVGFAPYHLIGQRKASRRAEARVILPRIVDADSIDTLGEPPKIESAGSYKAFALSSGDAIGPARIVKSPQEAGELGKGYILVCPSTDPSWTPLFVNAAGLVLECGGTLSHGAVVAREMGLPAVVLPDATRILKEGEEIRVDGRHGSVGRAGASDLPPLPVISTDPNDPNIPRMMVPPAPGRRERSGGKVRNIAFIAWGVYLLAALTLPEKWLYQPSLSALDLVLWPLVRGIGKPATVAVVAAGIAAMTMIVQRLFTDNARLREAKRRAAALNEAAKALPETSPRRQAMTRLAAPVQWRILAAAFLPIALLLGPMVMTFFWFPARVDPASWNAPAGSSVSIVATIDSDLKSPVTLTVSSPLQLDESKPAAWTAQPVREVLKRLLIKFKTPSDIPAQPWELKEAADRAREMAIADLEAYLNAGLPPQQADWTVRAAPDAAGRFEVILSTPGAAPLKAKVVLGDVSPPSPAVVDGAVGSPIKSIKIVYPGPKSQPMFWAPLSRIQTWLQSVFFRSGGESGQSGSFGWVDHWLVVYLLAYLPALFGLRWALRVA